MINFREWYNEKSLIESFELTDNYKRLSKSEMDRYWLKFHKVEDKELLGLFYQTHPMMKTYIAKNEGREYFIFSYIQDAVFEIHFFDTENMGDDDSLDRIRATKNSQSVFSIILSIVLKELEERPSRKILISAPSDRAKLYRKIVEKLLKQYNIQKTIRTYSSKDGNYDIQNFLLEMHQNVIYIGIE